MAAFLGPDLILDQDRGGAGAGEFAHGAAHVHGVAIAGIAVGDDGEARNRGTGVAHLVEHLGIADEPGIGQGKACRGDAEAAEQRHGQPRLHHQPGAQRVGDDRTDQEPGAAKQFTQSRGSAGHGSLPPSRLTAPS